MASTVPPAAPPAPYPPPPAVMWPPPPTKKGMPAWEVAIIVVVVVFVIVGVLAALLFVMVGALISDGNMRPVVTFSTPEAITNGFQVNVVGASQALPAGAYRMNLHLGAVAGTAVPLSAAMSFTIGGNTYSMAWSDVGGEGSLTAGDMLTVTRAGGLPSATEFRVLLLLADGSVVQQGFYTSP